LQKYCKLTAKVLGTEPMHIYAKTVDNASTVA